MNIFKEDTPSYFNEEFRSSQMFPVIEEHIKTKGLGDIIGMRVKKGHALDWYRLKHDCIILFDAPVDIILPEYIFITNFSKYCMPESFTEGYEYIERG